MLTLIGIGLSTPEDITVRGKRAVEDADTVYLEHYTSRLQCTHDDLEEFHDTAIQRADRDTVEDQDEILDKAEEEHVALMVIGDPFAATTHHQLYRRARQRDISVDVIHNASVITAVGQTGLQLYKFGQIASLPFRNVETPISIYKANLERGLHTLVLLDVTEDELMTVSQALQILDQHIPDDDILIGCARLGSENATIRSGTKETLRSAELGPPPHSLIIPGDLHFTEEEALKQWK